MAPSEMTAPHYTHDFSTVSRHDIQPTRYTVGPYLVSVFVGQNVWTLLFEEQDTACGDPILKVDSAHWFQP